MVSVILPTFNRQEMLSRAVESVIGQTFRDWELIVVDDGSSDGSSQTVAAFGDPRIRCFNRKHGGVSRARNSGIALARFAWICFLDSDDYWRPAKLQHQLEALRRFPEYRVIYTDETWIRRGRQVNPKQKHRKYGGWVYHRCLPLCIISPSSVMLHRRVLQTCGVFDPAFAVCEDYELWLRVTARYPVFYLDRRLIIKVGGHSDQLSRSRWGLDRYRVRALLKACRYGRLTPQQRIWTAGEIARKAEILAAGYQKRGKAGPAQAYRRLADSSVVYTNHRGAS